jgi:alginate O-acetyltransferase complex protein AlgJ
MAVSETKISLEKVRFWGAVTTLIIFLGILSVGLFGMMLRGVGLFPPSMIEEYEVTAEGFPEQWSDFVDRNFGGRQALIRMNAQWKLSVLRSAPSPDVIKGWKGWFFLGFSEGRNLIDDYQNNLSVRESAIEEMVDQIQNAGERSIELGAQYILVVAPYKSTIYPESLRIEVNNESRQSITDRFVSRMSEEGSEQFLIDLREPLLRGKSIGRLYHLTDTHWNQLGAYLAYREILGDLRVPIPEFDPNSNLLWRGKRGGDLVGLMSLRDVITEKYVVVTDAMEREVTRNNGDRLEVEGYAIDRRGFRNLRTFCDQGEIPSAIIFHDSFGVELIRWLSRHFREALFVWSPEFSAELVDQERPEFVIQVLLERNLRPGVNGF